MKYSRLTLLAVVSWIFAWSVVQALASPAIRSEPGDPYNKPVRLSRPRMICVVGLTEPQVICQASLAPPLSECECGRVSDVGLRYFILEPRQKPTVFTFDGYQDVYTALRRTFSGVSP